jgi:hypothetical protein
VVIALGLIGLAVTDAVIAILNFQTSDIMRSSDLSGVLGLLGLQGTSDASNGGWIIDLGAAAVSMGVATLLLLRPDRLVLASAGVWAAVAFLANLVTRKSGSFDMAVTYRCPVYFLVLVAAVVLLVVEYQVSSARAAKAKASESVPPPAA